MSVAAVLVLVLASGVAALGVVMTWKGKLPTFAAGLGSFHGLLVIGFATLGNLPYDRMATLGYPHHLEAAGFVTLLILQGVLMLVFSVATYKGRLWGAYGLCAVVILMGGVWLVMARTFTGVLTLVVYFAAAVSIRRRRARALELSPDTPDVRRCPHCGARYRVSDYRSDITSFVCSNCAAEISRTAPDTVDPRAVRQRYDP